MKNVNSSTEAPTLLLPTGERVTLPGGYDAGELSLAGNLHCLSRDLVYAYDPITGTGFCWSRYPAPHWQMVQPVTREGFEQWAASLNELTRLSAISGLLDDAASILKVCEEIRLSPASGGD